jgi:phage terminase large subunit GpA-like protein
MSSEFGNIDGVLAADRRAAAFLIPPPEMLPSVWAEKNIVIPVGNAIPGPINFDNNPLQREILDAIGSPGVRRADLMLAAQTGKTTILQALFAYFIVHEPRSQIMAQPSEGDVMTFQQTKLLPMLEANPNIASRLAKPRSREGVFNSRIWSYPGGWAMFSWSGSPKTARGRSAPVTMADEVDGMEATQEGDFLELLAQRSATFGDERLDLRSSTPVDMATSRIHKGWLAGDQRRYYVRCPHCQHLQYFKWENVHWRGRCSKNIEDADLDAAKDAEHDPESAMYRCDDPECGTLWNDGERIAAIRQAKAQGGGLIASKPFKGHISVHAPEMASPFRRLRDIVQSYLDKLALNDLQSFVNVSLGWPYEAGDKADPDSLYANREEWTAPVPMGGLWLSIGVDMQIDRLEYEVVAWGFGEESWSVDTGVLWGDPLLDEVWLDLEDVLANTYRHESGAILPISAAMVDTGGTSGMTAAAYAWLRGKTGRRIFGSKGTPGWGRPIIEKPHRKQTGKKKSKLTDLCLVGVDEAKLVVMRRLASRKPGPGHCHFPKDEGHDKEFFAQLTAERLVVRYVKGQAVREWHKNDKDRNEKLDCRVLAYAAMKLMLPSFKRIAERLGVQVPLWGADGDSKPEETAMKMKRKVRTAPPAQPAPPPASEAKPENPQEASETSQPNNSPKKRPKRSASGRKSWVTNW